MLGVIEPVETRSLKQACVQQLERLVFSGRWEPGTRLPPERQLAERLGVSRPVLHQALVDLAAKGLVRIEPRRGTFVNNYEDSGSLALLASLLVYHEQEAQSAFINDMLAFRLLVETETARLAAQARSRADVALLREIVSQEQVDGGTNQARTALDFRFHLRVAHASHNLLYPMILNSFKSVYLSYTGRFFRAYGGTPVVGEVVRFHQMLVEQIEAQDADRAAQTMRAMLQHGEEHLKGLAHD